MSGSRDWLAAWAAGSAAGVDRRPTGTGGDVAAPWWGAALWAVHGAETLPGHPRATVEATVSVRVQDDAGMFWLRLGRRDRPPVTVILDVYGMATDMGIAEEMGVTTVDEALVTDVVAWAAGVGVAVAGDDVVLAFG